MRDFCNCPVKSRKFLFLEVFPKNFSTYYNVRQTETGRSDMTDQLSRRILTLGPVFIALTIFISMARAELDGQRERVWTDTQGRKIHATLIVTPPEETGGQQGKRTVS